MSEQDQFGPTVVAVSDSADTLSAGDASQDAFAGDPFAPGSAIGDRYRIIELLGAGGMGAVYRARDVALERDVALKTLHMAAASPLAIKRLRREIKLAVRINHPNVIRVFDLSEVGRLRFMTMEVVEGPSLKTRLRSGLMSVEDACEVGRQIAQGLAAAHELGVVHRDLKPGNVLLAPEGRVVVADFGVAGEHNDATTASAIVGTAAYMPPEQANGEAASPAADIYALGVVMAEMLTGEIPLLGNGPLGTAMRRLNEAPPPVTALRKEIPEALDELVRRMLSRDPSERPAGATEVARVLGTWASDRPADLTASPPVRPRLWFAAAALALLVLAGAGAWLLRGGGGASNATACPSAGDQLQGVWDPARRAAVAGRLGAEGHASTGKVTGRIDDYVARWRSAHDDACRPGSTVAANTRRVQRACLGRLRDRLSATIGILADADEKVAPRALHLVSSLRMPRWCLAPTIVRQESPAVPSDPKVAKQIETVRMRLPRVWALVVAGQLDDAATLAKTLLRDARKTGFDPLIVESVYELARAYRVLLHPHTSATYRDALSLAQKSRYDLYIARAASDLLAYSAIQDAAVESAKSLTTTAQDAIDRLGDMPELRGEFHYAVAMHAYAADKLDMAHTHATRALDIAKEKLGASTALTMRVHALLGNIATWRSLLRDSARSWGRAIAVGEEVLGAEHPIVAHYRGEWSWPLAYVGECKTALAQARRAADTLRLVKRRRQRYGMVLIALANSLACGSRPELGEAQKRADEGANVIRGFGMESSSMAEVRSVQARIARLSGRLDDALRLERDSLRLRKLNGSEEGSWVAESQFYLGLIHLERKEVSDAENAFERSLALFMTMDGAARVQAYPLMGLGLVNLRRGNARKALALLERANSFHLDGQMIATYARTTEQALTAARKAVADAKQGSE